MARAANKGKGKRITRYMHDEVKEPRTPETGHTGLLPDEELLVSLPMDNGWTQAIDLGRLTSDEAARVVVDVDPAIDPLLLWAGKRSRKSVPVLPLQRNEIVSESRIGQIIARSRQAAEVGKPQQATLFADLERELREAERGKRVEFYTHGEAWKNKLICGDSLPVMESLIRYEGLSGSVQMVYFDPPYGIKYDANFQQRVDTARNGTDDGGDDVLTVKAFRDTWALGVHSYLSYIQERLYLARELLSSSGSVFVQIGDSQVHRVRMVLDEVFGASNFCAEIAFAKTSSFTSSLISSVFDTLLWYAKDRKQAVTKYRPLYEKREAIENPYERYICVETARGEIIDLSVAQKLGREPIPEGRLLRLRPTDSQGETEASRVAVDFQGRQYYPPRGRHWSVRPDGLREVIGKGRIVAVGNTLTWKSYRDEFPYREIANIWTDIRSTGFGEGKLYAVQTLPEVIERCISMTTEPGELVLDPTCGSGTTALCSERLGRRWVTCDTSRVAINVTRQRLLSAVFEHYLTRDRGPASGFYYATADRITLKSLAYDLEPEKVDLVDQPEIDKTAVRVSGPFEVMTLGRYSVEDWKGSVQMDGNGDPAKLQNYIEVICRLYRPDSAPQGAGGLVHAIADSESEKLAISVGPLTGRVTAQQVHEAVTDALSLGLLEVHLLGWAFEANVGEVKSKLESHGKVKVQLIMIRPDSLAEGLKVTNPDQLFSPLTLPEVKVDTHAGKATLTLKGVGVFDRRRRTTDYHSADDGYVVAWYLDEDYDGDCFVDCQSFFDFKKAPNLKPAAGGDVDAAEYAMQLTSQPFQVRGYKRAAVKVVDVFGNESTFVTRLP
jgi:adenine-specific DNA-methyltransferase